MKRQSLILRLAKTANAVPPFDFAQLQRRLAKEGVTLSEPPRDEYGRLPEDAVRDDIIEFQRLVDVGMRSWRVPAVLRQQLDVAFGRDRLSSRLLLSNARLRQEAALSLIDTIGTLWKRQRRISWWFITILDDRGNALEYDTALDLAGLRARFQATLAETGLNAVGLIEVQALTNAPQGTLGRSLLFHAHAVGWTDKPDFNGAAVQARLCASPMLRNVFGALTVRVDRVQPIYRHVTWKAFYLLKAPCDGKYIRRDAATPSGWGFARTGIRADVAVRVMEALSQLELSDVLLAAGDGIDVQAAWLADLRSWHRAQLSRFADFAAEGDVASIWQLLRSRRRGHARSEIRFDAAGGENFTAWESAMREWLAQKSATRRHSKKS